MIKKLGMNAFDNLARFYLILLAMLKLFLSHIALGSRTFAYILY